MSEAVRNAVWGAVVGVTLGAPLRARAAFSKLNFYEPVPARMASSEALDAWIVWARHLRGGKGAAGLGASMLAHWEYPVAESAFGLANLAQGFGSPLSGSLRNPLPSGANAVGRAAFWGLAFHGKPDEASHFAAYDAGLDHAGDGVVAAVAVARMISESWPERSETDLVRAASSVLRSSPALKAVRDKVVEDVSAGKPPAVTANALPQVAGTLDPLDARLAFGAVLLGLLHGRADFGRALLVCAGCGWAADQACLALGAVQALRINGAPDEWRAPLGTLYVAGHGLRQLEPPESIDDFCAIVGAAADEHAWQRPTGLEEATPPQDAGTEEQVDRMDGEGPRPEEIPAAADPGPAVAPSLPPVGEANEALLKRLAAEPNASSIELEGVQVAVQYVDPPVAKPGQTLKLVFEFTNVGEEDKTLGCSLAAPDGWQVATRLSSFRLRAGESSSFPAVLQPGPDSALGPIELHVNRFSLRLPILSPQRWYVVGPMANHDGQGFERGFPAESKHRLSDIFNGRSELPVRWTEEPSLGVSFDVEPVFKNAPGVIYLWGRFSFPESRQAKLVAAASTGVVVWVDGKRVVSYHDEHEPVPRAKAPYAAGVQLGGDTVILVKVVRNKTPLQPLVLYALGDDGRLLLPNASMPMQP